MPRLLPQAQDADQLSSGIQMLLLALFVLLMTLTFIPAVGSVDISIWQFWGENPYQYGLVRGYVLNHHEHPPGLTALLWFSQYLAIWLDIPARYAIKLTYLPFLLASAGLIYIWSGRQLALALFAYIALAYSAIALGYVDIYFAPFIIWAFLALQRGHYCRAFLAFTLACLIKYPPLMILPFFFLYVLQVSGVRRVPAFVALVWPSLCLVMLMLLVFGLEPVYALQRAFQHHILSAQALNLNWILTRLLLASGVMPITEQGDQATLMIMQANVPQGLIWLIRGLLVMGYLAAFSLFVWRKKTVENLLLCSLLAHFAYFMFAIGAHENHLFLSMLLAVMLYGLSPRYWALALGVVGISSFNLLAFYGLDGHPEELFVGMNIDPGTLLPAYEPYPIDLRLVFSVFNMAYFIALWVSVLQRPLLSRSI
jgi:hypothetical protein